MNTNNRFSCLYKQQIVKFLNQQTKYRNIEIYLKKTQPMSNNSITSTGKTKGDKNIRVFVRIRPFNDKQEPDKSCISGIEDKNITIKQKDAKQPHNFTFDGIFQSNATQTQVYEGVGNQIINQAFNGINGTIFCYGQTSSGKTHTCIGPDYTDSIHAGLLPRLIKQTLNKIEKQPKNIQAKMKISMVEIYNQKIKDLIDQSKSDLKIRSNKKQGIFLQNITQKYILVEQQAFNYLNIGISNRSVNATNMNSQSSRSHMVFIITLNTHDIYSGQAKSAKIILVDLAGSQKISKTGAQGKVLQQAKKINTSLTTLGKVINALSDGKSTHVPYRDSKLTRLLQQSLGGNSLTNLIINISPSSFNQSETLTSIRFGQRAKCIKNQPVVNKSYTIDQLLVLLKKAEETIQKQNIIIKQLSKKKRSGGYGALSIPTMITMHMIDDEDQQTQKSIECDDIEKQKTQQDNLIQSRQSSFTLVSEDKLFRHSHLSKQQNNNNNFDKNKQNITNQGQFIQRKVKKCQTLTDFPLKSLDFQEIKNIKNDKIDSQIMYNKNKQKIGQTTSSKNSIRFSQNNDQHFYSQQNYCNPNPVFNATFPAPIIEDEVQENLITPRNIIEKQISKPQRLSFGEDITNTQHNLDKIRQNLFELKLRYMQEKRQNSIKSMIIERKNRVIEKAKILRENQIVR